MATPFPVDAYHRRAKYADRTNLEKHSIQDRLSFAAIDQRMLVAMRFLPNYRQLGAHRLVLEPG